MRSAVPLLFILFSFLTLSSEFQFRHQTLWLAVCAGTVLLCLILHLFSAGRGQDRILSVGFLFSVCLLIAGLAALSGSPLLRLLYLPFTVAMLRFYRFGTIAVFACLVPLIEFRPLLSDAAAADPTERIFFSIIFSSSAVGAAWHVRRVRRERDAAAGELGKLKRDARTILKSTRMRSLVTDEVYIHYAALMQKTDVEIRELLEVIRAAVFADACTLFVPSGASFQMRCSTIETGAVAVTGGGLLGEYLRITDNNRKRPLYVKNAQEEKVEAGYEKGVKIQSVFVVPLVDKWSSGEEQERKQQEQGVFLGVLAVDNAIYDAFNEAHRKTVMMFARHLVRMLVRERVDLQIKRDLSGLEKLKQKSAQLTSSLKAGEIGRNLCEAAQEIEKSRAFFFLAEGGQFLLAHHTGEFSDRRQRFDFAGTIINLAIENRQSFYVGDARQYRKENIMPFLNDVVRSLIAIPLVSEDRVYGLFIMVSEAVDFLDPVQIDLITVLCNQASTSVANAQLHAEIERMATTDGLTGLFNHRSFQEKLTEEIRRMKRYNEPVSLLLTDIDHFKKVNDTYGHPAGDQVLRGVARMIREAIRDIDIPARYGGEEFAVILPKTVDRDARVIAERIRRMVMDSTFTADGKTLKVTISIGVASAPADADAKEDLIENTDKALYHAKHNGRNQTVLWSGIR
ncbi:MAG: hypothetical protein OHK006_01910 [Thermodesulfovibrionales bacterium]